ncbi:hypothetical protein [Paraburkholderia phosphatilytica]|uniref:hypothetical protein n=1 Tax=Paraburkholderia phosphatilytica TaxID=2282883 RepID=UPI000E46F3EE|nr:hypothetical protein [Paraburkholderia phosphatilytica]
MVRKVSLSSGNGRRHLKQPLSRQDADAIIVRFRVALEAVRQGRTDDACIKALVHVFLLVAFLKDAGHSRISADILRTTGDALFAHINGVRDLAGKPLPVAQLAQIVNEYDQQLRETRFEVLLKASQQLAGAYRNMKMRRDAQTLTAVEELEVCA